MGTIEVEILISLFIRASEKDDMTWAKAREYGDFELFKVVAREEISSLKKGSWVVVKRASVTMDELENINCSFALEGIDNGMVSVMRRLTLTCSDTR